MFHPNCQSIKLAHLTIGAKRKKHFENRHYKLSNDTSLYQNRGRKVKKDLM